MAFIDEIKARAKADKKTIVLPETEDVRTYQAAEAVLREGTADLILVGSKEEIEKNGAGFDLTGAVIVDPATSDKTESYIAKLVELRQKKGMTEEQAREILLTNYLYYGVMMVKEENYDDVLARYNQYKTDGNIETTTFHQSYGYEEFIEGIRPNMDESDEENKEEVQYQIASGLFKS